MCMVEIRNWKSLQSKVNICKSDVKIGDYADSLIDCRLHVKRSPLKYFTLCVEMLKSGRRPF